ncbi:MAG: tat (twin-arginine translocation) pathway signal sequence [Ignavibacteriae bacterium HGW-Ignavibacteriae-3]|nr:MAG: tat (twin-arginine translocation) pathway signal sequence [Ignavibacteriae bacterium HGW-Ignavibacteriae-3]
MDRRDFLKTGLLAGASFAVPGIYGSYFAKSSKVFVSNYDLVAIKNGEPEVMFDKGIEQLGGMKSFVKKNQKVLVKPNIGWDVIPERGGNTNPKLVKRIIEHCFDAGAKEVYVFDHTCDDWRRSYASSGIERAVKDAGGKIVSGDTENYYQDVTITGAKVLTKEKVHELVLESDVFINVPILKSHSSTRLTVSMKNLMGVVWDRGYWHRNNLHQCIADYGMFKKKPTLNVVDAYYVMKQNGPRGVSLNDIALMKSQIISSDMVSADAAAAKLFGLEPDTVSYIKIADSMGLGKKDLSSLNIKRLIL